MRYPNHLLKLIDVLKRLPGVGTKSAERFAFQMIDWPEAHLHEMGEVVKALRSKLKGCSDCACLMEDEKCHFCGSALRDKETLCVVASPRDVFAIEGTHEYKGLYHVLGGVLNPLEGVNPESLRLSALESRVKALGVKEMVIALDFTLEGDATALYVKQRFEGLGLKISRLAFGMPLGSSLDYVDGGTLAKAFTGRRQF